MADTAPNPPHDPSENAHQRTTDPHVDGLDPSTQVVTMGRPAREKGADLNPPIHLSSTFVGTGEPEPGEHIYARTTNKTWEPLEDAIATLEGSELPGLAFASGMGAVAAAMSLVPVGGTLMIPQMSYNGTVSLAHHLSEAGALHLKEVPIEQTQAVVDALPGTDVLWLESPTNPMMAVADLEALVSAAHAQGAIVVMDNTLSTPLRQRPLEWGVDVVVHSATKYIAGHSDLLMGLAVTSDADLRARLATHRTLGGGIPGPFEAWLALRGLRTMALRVDRAEATAGELARRLAEHPAVKTVRYPGLPDDPGHALAAKQQDGFGAMLSIELDGDAAHAEEFVKRLNVFTPATSLGGVESLVERRRRHPAEPLQVPENLIRLSIGIEHPEDLWADLDAALRGA